MKTQILVIALILMALWIYCHQNNNTPVLSENQTQIATLQQEVQHYQTLYQKRVAKDITADQSAKISQLTQHIQDLENNLAHTDQAKSLYSQKITDLEKQLFSLAHQKIKNQKEAKKLLNQLEKNWDRNKNLWENTEKDYLSKIENLNQVQSQKEQTIISLNKLVGEFTRQEKNLKTYLNQQGKNIQELEKLW